MTIKITMAQRTFHSSDDLAVRKMKALRQTLLRSRGDQYGTTPNTGRSREIEKSCSYQNGKQENYCGDNKQENYYGK